MGLGRQEFHRLWVKGNNQKEWCVVNIGNLGFARLGVQESEKYSSERADNVGRATYQLTLSTGVTTSPVALDPFAGKCMACYLTDLCNEVARPGVVSAEKNLKHKVLLRSLCTVVCKWTYTPDRGWDDTFWKMVGLEDLVKDKYEKIGNHVLSPGEAVGKGLTPEAAKDLGLPEGIAVAASLIDAHAGGLGVIGADVKGHNLPCENQPITSRVAMICGTSSCHMGVSEKPIFVPGVWGPYFSAMVPGLWLNEGGQSATGKLIDHVVRGHVAFPELQSKAAASAQSIYTYLNSHLDLIKKSLPVGFLTVDLHVWPDFHGNRSPLTDLTLKGMVVGLTLSRGLDELALIYLATIQAIALGTRHILETMQAAGHDINTLFLCGGLSKNPLFVQMHADITGKPVVLSREVESVLVGAAILGACASGDFASIQEATAKMGKIGRVVQPNHEHKRLHIKWRRQAYDGSKGANSNSEEKNPHETLPGEDSSQGKRQEEQHVIQLSPGCSSVTVMPVLSRDPTDVDCALGNEFPAWQLSRDPMDMDCALGTEFSAWPQSCLVTVHLPGGHGTAPDPGYLTRPHPHWLPGLYDGGKRLTLGCDTAREGKDIKLRNL
ncbi:FGGY carbohydrate kinase domain-containing protein isoform X11 [Pitangus sulphuratus]|nr:FGGY carbohydrate kinase domain-containing protein isoform X11 [Pitangus sulphuratus]